MLKENSTNFVHGFINVYKPMGLTSMNVVRQMKRLTGLRKRVGHGGTLDPLAEGVLPVCFGQATRLMAYLIEGGKEYEMEIRLGVTTTTYDAEGEVIDSKEVSSISDSLIAETLKSFEGTIYQTPPMYSALKVKGQRLYKLARSGIEIPREPRLVQIPKIEVIDFSSPDLKLRVECKRGAYMRSLGHDIGQKLGCGAYVTRLVRSRTGPFRSVDSIEINTLNENSNDAVWESHLLPVDYPLLEMKCVKVNQTSATYLARGQGIILPAHINIRSGYLEKYRAYSEEGVFLAIIKFDRSQERWLPDMVFDLRNPSPYAPDKAV